MAQGGASKFVVASVFVAGFASMATEMAAPRLLAPDFGMAQGVWAHVIGAVLVALAMGAAIGGLLADRHPDERSFAAALAAGGILIAGIPSIYSLVAPSGLPAQAAEIVPFVAALWASCLLLMPGVGLLGMVGPWAIRLSAGVDSGLGTVAGRLAAIAAVGSVVGTFLASFVLVPHLGTRATIVGVGGLVVATGALRLGNRGRFLAAGAWFLLAVPEIIGSNGMPHTIETTETTYQHVEVVDVAGGTALLYNEGAGYQSYAPTQTLYTGGYWDHVAVLGDVVSRPGADLRVLLLGLAGGTIVSLLEYRFGENRGLHVDGVEIDPGVTALARRHFGLDEHASLRVHTGDARAFLNRTTAKYDLVIVDAYQGFSPPFHLVTREFFKAVLDRLSPSGALAINLATPSPDTPLTRALAETLLSATPYVYGFDTGFSDGRLTNVILVAGRRPIEPPPTTRGDPAEPVVQQVASSWTEVSTSGGTVLTDERAPVGWLSMLSIVQAAGGAAESPSN